ncbi:homeobox protein 13 isoform X1 [Anastrepha ludens]|uniref:homeobox protein 13 isoform X1 n=1 Tax=Anastrepha ludens TaxID=28586 RepID=UPI0023B0CC36|nr:homeobox protein 13 isoform X1 [Anastrepha ludens]XP_053953865.1 homeobox protein 13 isoform X1 [Anastrepha ludens]XP_053953866.1 homeobox protein 13 isoform X1 [Anastrepha ludens]XP_053953868.1 homeobox protein 13 isoform X1 [Anastrepha ludens]XP_053953869.1 homeobox protein 13 isoform X1 [Anastrepha ludens]XP_053953870.1 homeobox protein 13 isoform X1 [Anastrepha ludens]
MEDNNTSTPMKTDESVTLTIRLIMQGKEVGSIIGKKGEIVNRFREESGAKINISDGSCPERIVTVSGTTSAIFSAFTLITKKFEEWCSQFSDVGKVGKTQIPIRLIVPASQCGSLIGKSGSKIKEIRQSTGCSIQVASEMLPNSTERAVTLSGTAEQITQCIYQICLVMLESPPRGATIPYRPKPQVSGPVILANGQAYTIQGNYAVPAQETCPVFPLALATGGLHAGISGLTDPLLKGAHLQGAVPAAHHHLQHIPDVAKNPLASLAALGLAGITPTNTGGLNPTAALAALAGSQLRTANTSRTQQQQHEMTVSNDLIGCIIGKGGTKIAEIRQISGAMIRISNCEEREGGNTDRTITISGNPDSVALAQYLINMSVELQKANLQEANNGTNGQSNNANNNNSNANAANGGSNGNANTNNSNHLSGGTSNLGGGNGGSGGSNSSLNQNSSNHSSNNSLNNLNTSSSNSNTNNNTSNTHSSTAMTITNSSNSGSNSNANNLTLNTTSSNPTNPFSSSLPFSNPPNPFATSTAVSSLATAIPLAQLLSKPGALNALSSLTALGGLTDLLGGLATLNGPPIQTTGVHRTKSFASTRFRSHNHADGNTDSEKTRNKFNPY